MKSLSLSKYFKKIYSAFVGALLRQINMLWMIFVIVIDRVFPNYDIEPNNPTPKMLLSKSIFVKLVKCGCRFLRCTLLLSFS